MRCKLSDPGEVIWQGSPTTGPPPRSTPAGGTTSPPPRLSRGSQRAPTLPVGERGTRNNHRPGTRWGTHSLGGRPRTPHRRQARCQTQPCTSCTSATEASHPQQPPLRSARNPASCRLRSELPALSGGTHGRRRTGPSAPHHMHGQRAGQSMVGAAVGTVQADSLGRARQRQRTSLDILGQTRIDKDRQ